MSSAEYAIGVTIAVLVATACGVGGRGVRRRIAPTLDGASGATATTVVALALFFGVGQVLGAVGLFSRGPVALGSVAAGVAGWAVGRGRSGGPRAEGGTPRLRLEPVAAAALIGLTLTQYWARTLATMRYGPTAGDTLIYHLPFAARFVQEGSVTALHQVAAGGVTTPFNPANPELLHAAGMLAFRSDILSPVLNVGWLAALVLAAWAAGSTRDAGGLACVGVLAIGAAPLMVTTHAGGANSDLAAIFFVLASVALLLDHRAGTLPLAALAAGLALGTKVSVVALVAFLTAVAVVGAGRGQRLRVALVWTAMLVVGGGYWYAVNIARVGTPFPGLPLGIGPVSFPRPELPLLDDFGFSVAHYLTDANVWRRWFLPGLRSGFGAWWPATFALAMGAAGWTALSERRSVARGVGLAALGAGIVYVLTPTTALGPEGAPHLFLGNLRYLMPALAVGLVLAALVAGAASPRLRLVALVVLAVCAAAPLVTGSGAVWRGPDRVTALAVGVGTAAMVLVVVLHRRSRVVGVAIVGALALVAVAGWQTRGEYLRVRYASAQPGMPAVFDWARDVRDERIGIAGFFQQYPLYGLDLSNRVQYVGRDGDHGAFFEIGDCRAWRRAVHAGRYRFVVTSAAFAADREEPRQAGWTRTDPSATEVLQSGLASVFELEGRLTTEGCAP